MFDQGNVLFFEGSVCLIPAGQIGTHPQRRIHTEGNELFHSLCNEQIHRNPNVSQLDRLRLGLTAAESSATTKKNSTTQSSAFFNNLLLDFSFRILL
jgi:hypothetical protein